MLCQTCVPYRGYGIYVNVTEYDTVSFNGTELRYNAMWSIRREDNLRASTLASVPEPVEFMSVGEELDYAQARAHVFIDSLLAVRGDAVEQRDNELAASGPRRRRVTP
jgi:hypothetical protein